MIGNTSEAAVSKELPPEMLGGCCVCSDEEGWADNSLVYCDGEGCSVAVHQACYGILRVPDGDWYCRRCEAIRNGKCQASDIRCELCHTRDGALKPTENNKWCHVICALYIPEATFGDVQAMEPIILKNVQRDRFGRVCSLCNNNKGACTQCGCSSNTNVASTGRSLTACNASFHVTCAQSRGYLCELQIGGTTRYPAYCEEHLKTLKPGLKLKRLPPFKNSTGLAGIVSDPPSLRSRRKDDAKATDKSNGDHSPVVGTDEMRSTRSAATSVGVPEGNITPRPEKDKNREKDKEKDRIKDKERDKEKDADRERKKAKLLKKRQMAEMANGKLPDSEKSEKPSKTDRLDKTLDVDKKRGRQKSSSSKKHLSEVKESPVVSGENGGILYGKLSEEAAIRVRHSSEKDSAKGAISNEQAASEVQEAVNTSSIKVDLWSIFSQKKSADAVSSASTVYLPKPEPNSLEELLDDKFWRETGRFLLTEIQHSAPADIVELLHALYQVELENQQLEAKIATMSSTVDAQKLTAARLAVPLNSSLPQIGSVSSNQTSSTTNNAQNSNTIAMQQPALTHPGFAAIPTALPFMFPGHPITNGNLNSQSSNAASFAAVKAQPTTNSSNPTSTPNGSSGNKSSIVSANVPPSPYGMTADVAAMQQVQFQLYQQLYQQQLHHLQPPPGQSLPAQPKLEPFGNQLPMPQQPHQTSTTASVLSSLSSIPNQQQQRSLPLKLVEPSPGAAISSSLMMATGPTAPEGVLVPPPPLLTTSTTSTCSSKKIEAAKSNATDVSS